MHILVIVMFFIFFFFSSAFYRRCRRRLSHSLQSIGFEWLVLNANAAYIFFLVVTVRSERTWNLNHIFLMCNYLLLNCESTMCQSVCGWMLRYILTVYALTIELASVFFSSFFFCYICKWCATMTTMSIEEWKMVWSGPGTMCVRVSWRDAARTAYTNCLPLIKSYGRV